MFTFKIKTSDGRDAERWKVLSNPAMTTWVVNEQGEETNKVNVVIQVGLWASEEAYDLDYNMILSGPVTIPNVNPGDMAPGPGMDDIILSIWAITGCPFDQTKIPVVP